MNLSRLVRRLVLTVVLARRLLRDRRGVAALLTATVAVLVASYSGLSVLTPSAEQLVRRDLGTAGAYVGYGSIPVPPGQDAVKGALAGAVEKVGAGGVRVSLNTTELRVPGLAQTAPMFETAWRSEPFPDRYSLTSGRWPASPGEVVVAQGARGRFAPSPVVAAMSGRLPLRVVGTARDAFQVLPTFLSAPGTWASVDPGLLSDFTAFTSQPVVYWDGTQVNRVVDAVTAVAQGWPGTAGHADTAAAIRDSLGTAASVRASSARSWLQRTPAGYAVPSLVLPVLAVLTTFAFGMRRARAREVLFTVAGLPRPIAVVSTAVATSLRLLCAWAVGMVAGWLGSVVAVRAIERFSARPSLSPAPSLVGPAGRLVGCTLLACLAGTAWMALRAPTVSRTDRPSASRTGERLRDARHLFAVAVACLALVQYNSVDRPERVAQFAAVLFVAVVLVLPECLDRVLVLLPERQARTRLIRRQLTSGLERATLTVAVVAVAVAGPAGYLTLVGTTQASAENELVPLVLDGQVLVVNRLTDLLPPSPAVLAAVDSAGAVPTARTQLAYAVLFDDTSRVVREVEAGASRDTFLVAQDPRAVLAALGTDLTAAQADVLEHGGAVVWAGAAASEASSRVDVRTLDADRKLVGRASLATAPARVPSVSWTNGTVGLVTTRTANDIGLPQTQASVLLSGVSESGVTAIRTAVARAGMDTETVLFPADNPVAPGPAPAAVVAAAALALLAALLNVSVGTASTSALRAKAGRLLLVGVPLRWTRQVVAGEHMFLLTVGLGLGLFLAVPPYVLTLGKLDGYTVDVPWLTLLCLVVAVLAANGAAVLVAVRKVTCSPFPN